jgi:transcriptional regulator with PAS, ATPase and Fis domain
MEKKTVCYIANSEATSNFISKQLTDFLGDYIKVYEWCLAIEDILPYSDCDIYLVASNTLLEIVQSQLPPSATILVASRTIDTQNLDKLFEISPGTRVAVVGYWKEVAFSTINILKNLGFNYFEMIPYYLNCGITLPEDIEVAISPGVNYVVPGHIKKIIDIGVRGLDLSTFAKLIEQLDISREMINEISHYYIEAILNISLKHYKEASINEELKKKMEVILNTVDEAIVAVDENNRIVVLNPIAERLLEINSIQVLNKDVGKVIPQVDFLPCLQTGESIIHEIKRINDNYFILNTNPIIGDTGIISGVVATFRPVGQVKELEVKVRRELKTKGNIATYTFNHIVGESKEVLKALGLAKKFARTDLTILLEGESGTGKEIFAQAIHNYSEREEGSFVAINFAALPENLVESELFGYEDGAFTGAKKGGKAGLFEEAHMGTILLDEIGDATMEVQKRLLRVLEEHKVRRVGGNTLTPVNVRVIAATNQNLESLMQQGLFREDLFYRLCTLPIIVPSLRFRGEDIFVLINYFSLKLYNRMLNLEAPLKDFLLNYRWPGNIRELQNVVKYICSIVGTGEVVTIRHLPSYMMRNMERIQEFADEPKAQENVSFDVVVSKLQSQDLLEPIVMILSEIQSSSSFSIGIGRQALHKNMQARNKDFPDHKIRKWLKILDELGYVDSGKTRQGSKITREGEMFLTNVKKSGLK